MRARDRFMVQDVTCEVNGEILPVVDLSLGGFFMATEHPPLPAQVVSTRIHLPGGTAVSVLGKVAWVNGIQRRKHLSRPCGCGVQMLRISFLDKLAIVATLRHVSLPPSLARSAPPGVSVHK